MKKRSKVSIFILLAYCVPYMFLGMYGDYTFSTIGVYVLAFAIMTVLSIYCKKTQRIFIALVGNVVSFLTSYLFTACLATEGWSYYFKAFPPTISTVYFSLGMLLIQITVLTVTKGTVHDCKI